MKKIIIAFVLLFPITSFASIDVNLNYGSHGSEVTELQEFLIDKGFLASPATGNFYTLTRKAVVQYQSSINLPTSGFVGPMTRGKINAELAIGATGEVQETGTTNTPVVTPSTDTALLQKQLELLRQQVAQMFEQQKVQNQQTQQTNQTLTQIQQNTAPAPIVVPPPVPASVPTSLKLVFPNTNQSYPEFLGANCGGPAVNISVLDQFGNPMKGQPVMMTAPDFQSTDFTNSASGTNATDWYNHFGYNTQMREGTLLLTFKSGDLTKTATVHIYDGLTRDKIRQDTPNSRWYETGGGQSVNPVTLMCI